jgi:hypothetical protein
MPRRTRRKHDPIYDSTGLLRLGWLAVGRWLFFCFCFFDGEGLVYRLVGCPHVGLSPTNCKGNSAWVEVDVLFPLPCQPGDAG